MEQKDYIFEKLTPDNDVDISVYDEAIGFVFDNEDVTNIAISGAYGAGKSSVIKSYEKKHEEKKFIHISLAHFEPMDVEEENDATDETVLEGKILNQLIHQIPVSRIPQTNFRVKKDFGRKNIISITVLFYVLIGSITFLFALAGVKIGNLFGDRFEKQAGILGGCILLAIGVKILLEGLGILG